jgi:hypothetical protein
MLDFLNTIGLPGVMALIGCWMMVGAIIGKLLALSHLLQQDVVLQRVYQRVMLGVFGAVLLGPGLHLVYQGSAARVVSPTPVDYVAPPASASHTTAQPQASEIPHSHARLLRASAVFAAPQKSCRTVESFGLYAHNLRRLKYQPFHGQVYAYVGDISSPNNGATNVYLFSTSTSAPGDGKIDDPTFQRLWGSASPLQAQKAIRSLGDSFTFPYDGAQFKLTVTQIYKVLVGSDEIVVDICEL